MDEEELDPEKKLETGFTFNMNLIKEPDKLIENLHSKGIRVGLQINPQDGIYPHEANYETMKELRCPDAKIVLQGFGTI